MGGLHVCRHQRHRHPPPDHIHVVSSRFFQLGLIIGLDMLLTMPLYSAALRIPLGRMITWQRSRSGACVCMHLLRSTRI